MTKPFIGCLDLINAQQKLRGLGLVTFSAFSTRFESWSRPTPKNHKIKGGFFYLDLSTEMHFGEHFFERGYVRRFWFLRIMITSFRKVRIAAFWRYFKIFVKVQISKKRIEKCCFFGFSIVARTHTGAVLWVTNSQVQVSAATVPLITDLSSLPQWDMLLFWLKNN